MWSLPPNLWFGEVILWSPNAVWWQVSLVIWAWIRWTIFLPDPNKPHEEVNNRAVLDKKSLVHAQPGDPKESNLHFVSLSVFWGIYFRFQVESNPSCECNREMFCTRFTIGMNVFESRALNMSVFLHLISVKTLTEGCGYSVLFHSFNSSNMSAVTSQQHTDPISAVGVICSLNKAPDDYCAVSIHLQLQGNIFSQTGWFISLQLGGFNIL